MKTIDVPELEAFVNVVRDGSFTKAADRMGTRKAHLSRVVSRLEARLGARLLQRTTRSLALTELGREVCERAVAILTAIDETVRAVQKTQEVPSGTLRITCGVEFGLLAVNEWVGAYLAKYPEVRVEADFTNRVVDVVHEGFDVSVRVGPLEDSGLAARKLGEITYGLFASPSYVKEHGIPRTAEQLNAYDLVLSTQTRRGRGKWELTRGAARLTLTAVPRLLVNTHMAVRDAVLRGVGIGLLPTFQAQPFVTSGALRPILDGWARDSVPVHAVYPSSLFLAPKVRAFVDEAVAGFGRLVGGKPRGSAPKANAARPHRVG
jgi:LysR family transcriptional regulator, regulator for bpeEF and oprC